MLRSQPIRSGRRRLKQRRQPHRRSRVESLENRSLLATFTVNSVLDTVDSSDSLLTLREAIDVANCEPGPDVIRFDLGHDTPAVIRLEQGELEIIEALAIRGPGANLLTIDAQQNSRVFNITAGSGDFAISGVTLTGGLTSGENEDPESTMMAGGAIRSMSHGVLSIENSAISDNAAQGDGAKGGGIYAAGGLQLNSSTISGNTADHSGGGVYAREVNVQASEVTSNVAGAAVAASYTKYSNGGGISSSGDVTITASTVTSNSTRSWYGEGGGVYGGGNVTVNSSTVSGNTSGGSNSIGAVKGTYLTVVNSTISGNQGGGLEGLEVTVVSSTVVGNLRDGDGCNAPEVGGGGIQSTGAVTIENSIVAGNTYRNSRGDVLAGALTVAYSLVGYNANTSLEEAPLGRPDQNGNLIGGPLNDAIDPLLGPLADNGGPTQTHALRDGSPAIDHGDPAAAAGVGDTLLNDQRGGVIARVAYGRIDMGAVEVQAQAADFDEDGDVDGEDLVLLQANLPMPTGATHTDGDADRDGDVDNDDLQIWQTDSGSGDDADTNVTPDHSTARQGPAVDRVFSRMGKKSDQDGRSSNVEPLGEFVVDSPLLKSLRSRS